MAVIDQLSVSLVARTKQWSKGFARARKDLSAFSRHVSGVATGVSGMAAALLGAGSLGGFAALVKHQADAMETTGSFAGRLRTSTEELVAFRYAAAQSEIEAGTFDTSLQQLVKRSDDAARGTGEAGNALADLGIDAQAFAKLPLGEKLLTLADRFSQMGDAGRAAADAQAVFGKSGQPMLQLLNQGAEAIKAMTDRADKLGLLFSNVDAAKVDEANDALADLSFLAQGAANTVAVALAPTVEGLAEHLIDASGGGKKLGDTIVDAMERAALSLSHVADLVSLLKGEWYGFQGVVQQVASWVVSGLKAMGAGVDWIIKKIPGSGFFNTPENQAKFNQEQGVLQDLAERFQKAADDSFAQAMTNLNDFANGESSKALRQFFTDVRAKANEVSSRPNTPHRGQLPPERLGTWKSDPFAARAVNLRDTFVGALGGQGGKKQTVHDAQLVTTNELLRDIKRQIKGPVAL